jgi:hypothetical protein
MAMVAESLKPVGSKFGKTMRSGQFVSESMQEKVLHAQELMANDISIRKATSRVNLSPTALFRYVLE